VAVYFPGRRQLDSRVPEHWLLAEASYKTTTQPVPNLKTGARRDHPPAPCSAKEHPHRAQVPELEVPKTIMLAELGCFDQARSLLSQTIAQLNERGLALFARSAPRRKVDRRKSDATR
jgi:hypothetical protein